MGYVVLHMSKAKGNDSRMTAHIERTVEPKNADKSRTHLNKELIDLPDEFNRTQAIQHRIETAGIKRKITKDQVRVIRINLSGTHEDMKRIEAEDRLDEWCKDTVDYLKKEFGEKNVVSAVLHMDEKTPHIHASVVPVVTGQRRKAKEGSKNKSVVRLCADDIMTKTKMVEYQDNYAEVMAKYGLERGIRGSEARHITTGEYYRDIFEKAETVKEEVGLLQHQKAEEQLRLTTLQEETKRKTSELEEKEKQLRQIKSEVVKVGFEKSAKSAGKEVLEGIGALMGNPKAKKLQSEVDSLKQDIEILQEEKQNIENQAQKAMTEKDRLILEKDSLIATQKGKLDQLFDSIPILKDYDFIIRLCQTVKIPFEIVKQIFSGKTVPYTGELYSPEHKQNFKLENAIISIGKSKENKPLLAINGIYYVEWFREQKKKFLENIGINIQEKNKTNKNIKMW